MTSSKKNDLIRHLYIIADVIADVIADDSSVRWIRMLLRRHES